MTDLQYLALEDMKQLIEDAEVGLFNVKIAKNGVECEAKYGKLSEIHSKLGRLVRALLAEENGK